MSSNGETGARERALHLRIRTALPTTGWNGKRESERGGAQRRRIRRGRGLEILERRCLGKRRSVESTIRLVFTGLDHTRSRGRGVVYPLGRARPRRDSNPRRPACSSELPQYHIVRGSVTSGSGAWRRRSSVPGQDGDGDPRQLVGEEDESVYVWIRGSRTSKSASDSTTLVYQATTEERDSPKVPTMIDREQIKVTRLVATPTRSSSNGPRGHRMKVAFGISLSPGTPLLRRKTRAGSSTSRRWPTIRRRGLGTHDTAFIGATPMSEPR